MIQTPGVNQFFGCRPLGPVGRGIGLGAAASASLMAPAMADLLATVMAALTQVHSLRFAPDQGL